MKKFLKIFKRRQVIVGMIHLKALPGTPNYENNDTEIIESALKEAQIYKKAGIDALAIENMHDVPYIKNEVGHEISAMMTVIGYKIKAETNLPCGIQILSSANKAALAVAKAANLDFIRAEGFVYGHVADEGYIDSCAGDLLRYRKQIDAENIAVFTDIKKKHSAHALTADVSLVETAKTAEYFLSDGLIITGTSTGSAANLEEIQAVKTACKIPVIVGSGVTLNNLESYLSVADALIVGSYFKENGHWAGALSYKKISQFMEKVNKLRQ
ncbi:MAG: BtpA/SgcQ family protein [Flavobacteriaceae bacterium]|nr:BtpA/SgcQ family protein [Flavobacteriaceae bacterium]